MTTHTLREQRNKKYSTFKIACIICGIIAFIQVMMMGVALATRLGETRVVTKTIETDPQIYYIPTIAEERSVPRTKVKPRSHEELLNKYGNEPIDTAQLIYQSRIKQNQRSFGVPIRPLNQPRTSRFNMIRNTQVEKLVEDAHAFQLKGDVVRAILKLDEAQMLDPKEPAVIYRRAKVYEDMRNWERATDAYDALFRLGPETGAYYEIASDKIANGIQDSPDTIPFKLGNVIQKTSKDRLYAKVTIPIRRITTRDFEASQIEIRIFFYDVVDNKTVEAVPKQREQNIAKRWITGNADWANGLEETIEAEYQLPALDRANVHLFGERKFFGQVVELYYKGELMDQFASPGRLHGLHAQEQFKHQIQPEMLPFDLHDSNGDGSELLLPEVGS